jgi:hypothetical protein
MNDLHEGLQAVSDADPIFAPQGLAVVSPTAGEAYAAEQISCGEAVDTHRSRRQQEPENPFWQTIT